MLAGARPGARTQEKDQEPGFWEALKDLFMPDEDRATYAEGLRRGGYVVTVRTDSAHYSKAIDILDDEGTVDLDQRSAQWRTEGWTHSRPRAAMGTSTAAGSTSSSGAVGRRDESIPIAEEELRIGKRDVSHGKVRVRSYVVETPVNEQVNLREETVRVDRRPVDRAATGNENLFKERVIEAEEHGEEAVVSKQTRVKEEVTLRKEGTARTETVSDKVRRTEVEVDDQRHTTRTGQRNTR
jgi:uncharacterized protein (TIGR02271 family)